MEHIKESFQKVKQDIDSLKEELDFLRDNIIENRKGIIELHDILKEIQIKLDSSIKKSELNASTDRQTNPTFSTHNSTQDMSFKPLNPKNLPFSTGNEGVSTDRQTGNPTDRQTPLYEKNTINNAQEVLDSLDNIKKEIRIKFKSITEQEFLVFSTIYQLEDELGYSDYKIISQKLNLSESSIRDYVGRLIKKGIPLEKKKINNKNIKIFISQNLKKMATLHTILQLREI